MQSSEIPNPHFGTSINPETSDTSESDSNDESFIPKIQDSFTMHELSLFEMMQRYETAQHSKSIFKEGSILYSHELALYSVMRQLRLTGPIKYNCIPMNFFECLIRKGLDFLSVNKLRRELKSYGKRKRNRKEVDKEPHSIERLMSSAIEKATVQSSMNDAMFTSQGDVAPNETQYQNIERIVIKQEVLSDTENEQIDNSASFPQSVSCGQRQKWNQIITNSKCELEGLVGNNLFGVKIKTETDLNCDNVIEDMPKTHGVYRDIVEPYPTTEAYSGSTAFSTTADIPSISNTNTSQPAAVTLHTALQSNQTIKTENIEPEDTQQAVEEHNLSSNSSPQGKSSDVAPVYSCSHCQDTSFADPSKLVYHELEVHMAAGSCYFCGLTLPNVKWGLDHICEKHSKVYQCVCGKKFTTMQEYEEHREDKVHMPLPKEKLEVYICILCNKQINSKTTFLLHFRNKGSLRGCSACKVHSSEAKCVACEQVFIDKQAKEFHQSNVANQAYMGWDRSYLTLKVIQEQKMVERAKRVNRIEFMGKQLHYNPDKFIPFSYYDLDLADIFIKAVFKQLEALEWSKDLTQTMTTDIFFMCISTSHIKKLFTQYDDVIHPFASSVIMNKNVELLREEVRKYFLKVKTMYAEAVEKKPRGSQDIDNFYLQFFEPAELSSIKASIKPEESSLQSNPDAVLALPCKDESLDFTPKDFTPKDFTPKGFTPMDSSVHENTTAICMEPSHTSVQIGSSTDVGQQKGPSSGILNSAVGNTIVINNQQGGGNSIILGGSVNQVFISNDGMTIMPESANTVQLNPSRTDLQTSNSSILTIPPSNPAVNQSIGTSIASSISLTGSQPLVFPPGTVMIGNQNRVNQSTTYSAMQNLNMTQNQNVEGNNQSKLPVFVQNMNQSESPVVTQSLLYPIMNTAGQVQVSTPLPGCTNKEPYCTNLALPIVKNIAVKDDPGPKLIQQKDLSHNGSLDKITQMGSRLVYEGSNVTLCTTTTAATTTTSTMDQNTRTTRSSSKAETKTTKDGQRHNIEIKSKIDDTIYDMRLLGFMENFVQQKCDVIDKLNSKVLDRQSIQDTQMGILKNYREIKPAAVRERGNESDLISSLIQKRKFRKKYKKRKKKQICESSHEKSTDTQYSITLRKRKPMNYYGEVYSEHSTEESENETGSESNNKRREDGKATHTVRLISDEEYDPDGSDSDRSDVDQNYGTENDEKDNQGNVKDMSMANSKDTALSYVPLLFVNSNTLHHQDSMSSAKSSSIGTEGRNSLSTMGGINLDTAGSINLGTTGSINLGTSGNIIPDATGGINLGTTGSIIPVAAGGINLGTAGSINLDTAGSINQGTAGSIIPDAAGGINLGTAGSINQGTAGSIIPVAAGGINLGTAGSINLDTAGSINQGTAGSIIPDAAGGINLGTAGSIIPDAAGSINLGTVGESNRRTAGCSNRSTVRSSNRITAGRRSFGTVGGNCLGSAGNKKVGKKIGRPRKKKRITPRVSELLKAGKWKSGLELYGGVVMASNDTENVTIDLCENEDIPIENVSTKTNQRSTEKAKMAMKAKTRLEMGDGWKLCSLKELDEQSQVEREVHTSSSPHCTSETNVSLNKDASDKQVKNIVNETESSLFKKSCVGEQIKDSMDTNILEKTKSDSGDTNNTEKRNGDSASVDIPVSSECAVNVDLMSKPWCTKYQPDAAYKCCYVRLVENKTANKMVEDLKRRQNKCPEKPHMNVGSYNDEVEKATNSKQSLRKYLNDKIANTDKIDWCTESTVVVKSTVRKQGNIKTIEETSQSVTSTANIAANSDSSTWNINHNGKDTNKVSVIKTEWNEFETEKIDKQKARNLDENKVVDWQEIKLERSEDPDIVDLTQMESSDTFTSTYEPDHFVGTDPKSHHLKPKKIQRSRPFKKQHKLMPSFITNVAVCPKFRSRYYQEDVSFKNLIDHIRSYSAATVPRVKLVEIFCQVYNLCISRNVTQDDIENIILFLGKKHIWNMLVQDLRDSEDNGGQQRAQQPITSEDNMLSAEYMNDHHRTNAVLYFLKLFLECYEYNSYLPINKIKPHQHDQDTNSNHRVVDDRNKTSSILKQIRPKDGSPKLYLNPEASPALVIKSPTMKDLLASKTEYISYKEWLVSKESYCAAKKPRLASKESQKDPVQLAPKPSVSSDADDPSGKQMSPSSVPSINQAQADPQMPTQSEPHIQAPIQIKTEPKETPTERPQPHTLSHQFPFQMPVILQPTNQQSTIFQPTSQQTNLLQASNQQTVLQPTSQQASILQSPSQQSAFLQPTNQPTAFLHPTSQQTGILQPPSQQSAFLQPTSQQTGILQPPSQQSAFLQPTIQQTGILQPPSQQTTIFQPPNQPFLQQTNQQIAILQPTNQQAAILPSPSQHAVTLQPPNQQGTILQPAIQQTTIVQPTNQQSTNIQPTGQQSAVLPSTNQQAAVLQSTNQHTASLQSTSQQASSNQPSNDIDMETKFLLVPVLRNNQVILQAVPVIGQPPYQQNLSQP